MALTQYAARDANDNDVQLTNSNDPAEGGGATLEDLRALLDQLETLLDAFKLTASGQVVINALDHTEDSVEIGDQNADLASELTQINLSSYDEINKGPATDTTFSPAYDAIRFLGGATGDVEFVDGSGNTILYSDSEITAGERLPYTVTEISSTNTTRATSDIELLRY